MAKVGQPLIDIEFAGGAVQAGSASSAASTSSSASAVSVGAVAHPTGDVFNEITTKSGSKLKVLATPAVRRILPAANALPLCLVHP